MAKATKIQWTDATWNPWHGCEKVSPGCKYCYMYRDKDRYGLDPTKVVKSKTRFNAPLAWFNQLASCEHPDPANVFWGMKIFTCSWSDFFIEDADEWRDEAWRIIKHTSNFMGCSDLGFTYQILTKRPERIAQCLPDDWGEGYPNVWIGVSVESDAQKDRIMELDLIPSVAKFASFEPLIGPVYLDPYLLSILDWVIIGGESGNETGKYKYRTMSLSWLEDIGMDCETMGVPVFVKQLGTGLAKKLQLKDRHGGDIEEWPDWVKIREFPKT